MAKYIILFLVIYSAQMTYSRWKVADKYWKAGVKHGAKVNPAKTEWQQYLYIFKPGRLMVGHIRGYETKDYFYLTKRQTLHYLATEELPQRLSKTVSDTEGGKNAKDTP